MSVNECQSNNIKDITSLMIDRIRKTQGLLSDKWLLFGVPLPWEYQKGSKDRQYWPRSKAAGHNVACYIITKAGRLLTVC